MKSTSMTCAPPPATQAGMPTAWSVAGRGSLKAGVRQRQAGIYAVEFALVALIFFTLIFTIVEVSRALYMWNTLKQVTRSAAWAAATTNFSDGSAMASVRHKAIFRGSGGTLALSAPVTDQHVVIDYMALTKVGNAWAMTPISAASVPGCPARNRLICMQDASDARCIRFVRARICTPGSNCDPVPYKPLFPLVDLPISLPVSTTILKAQSLGHTPGAPMCN